ncbi:MAG: hypothetical protein IKB87_02690 [Clostridia bacterium]|nr:hypothetical protein [Clostridia bacterium]
MRIVEMFDVSSTAAKAFVDASESDFQNRLTEVSRHIVRDDRVECIMLSGPTCSGKTTMAAKLTREITAAGKRAVVLSIDDFFKEHSAMKRVGDQVDYDSIDAIDLPYFAECVNKMLRDENTPLPRFDFITGTRLEGNPYLHTPDDIIIFEGIQAVYPEVLALFEGYSFKSLSIAVRETLSVNSAVFAPEEIRLARRIVRDYKFRSASPEFTFHIWRGVRENEEKNITPYLGTCDYCIDSLMPYEPFMISPFLIPLLESIPAGSRYYSEAKTFREKFRAVENFPISSDLLPENSLYREFLG